MAETTDTTPAPTPLLMRTREAASILGVTPNTLRAFVAVGAVRMVRLTPKGPFRFTESDLLDAIENGRTG